MLKHKIMLVKKNHTQESVETQTTTTPRNYDMENLFSETLNILFDGMARGNQVDKKSAEALIKSVHYKTSKDFYMQCLEAYEEALKLHEAVFTDDIVKKVTQNISKMMNEGRDSIKKITQKIILPPNNETKI